MILTNALLSFIVRMNFIIAITGGILITGIARTFALTNFLDYGKFGFFSILAVYNGQRLYKANAETQVPTLKWVFRHRLSILSFSIMCFLLTIFFFFQVVEHISVSEILLFVVAAPLTIFYVVPIGGLNIRDRPHLKAHITAIAWTSVIVVFPILNANVTDWVNILSFTSGLYCYFLAVTISFDIRDLKYDLPTQRTLPQVLGIRGVKKLEILLLTYTLISLGLISQVNFNHSLFVLAISMQMCLIGFAKTDYGDNYYSVLIDGSIALLGISLLTS